MTTANARPRPGGPGPGPRVAESIAALRAGAVARGVVRSGDARSGASVGGRAARLVRRRPGQPGWFADLATLVPGDEVFVDQEGSHRLRFVAESVESFAKAEFPGERIYLADDAIRLNLVTCGGAFDEVTGHYVDNVMAFTTLAP